MYYKQCSIIFTFDFMRYIPSFLLSNEMCLPVICLCTTSRELLFKTQIFRCGNDVTVGIKVSCLFNKETLASDRVAAAGGSGRPDLCRWNQEFFPLTFQDDLVCYWWSVSGECDNVRSISVVVNWSVSSGSFSITFSWSVWQIVISVPSLLFVTRCIDDESTVRIGSSSRLTQFAFFEAFISFWTGRRL